MIRWLQRAKDEHHEEHCSKPRNPDLAVLVDQLTCQNNVLRGDNSDLIDMNNEHRLIDRLILRHYYDLGVLITSA